MDYTDVCPPSVVELILQANLASSTAGTLFSRIASASQLDCQVAALQAVANRISARSDLQVIDDFTGAVATYARFLSPEAKAAVKEAYLLMPYSPSVALNYFGGLRATGIDIRDHLGRLPEDWSFQQPRQGAATWHQYLYLASLGDRDALKALADKIAATSNGNDATNLLQSLSELKAEGVDAILQSYANDQRTADGTEGPGMPIAQNVMIWLMMRATP